MGSNEQPDAQCRICFANFADPDAFTRHMEVHVRIPRPPQPEPEALPPPPPSTAKATATANKSDAQPIRRKRNAKPASSTPVAATDDQTSTRSSIAAMDVTSRPSRMGGWKNKKQKSDSKPVESLPQWQVKKGAASSFNGGRANAMSPSGKRRGRPLMSVLEEGSREPSRQSGGFSLSWASKSFSADDSTAENGPPLKNIYDLSFACLSIVNNRALEQDEGRTVCDLASELHIAITAMVTNIMQKCFADKQYGTTDADDGADGNDIDGSASLEVVADHFSLVCQICQTFSSDACDGKLPSEVLLIIWRLFCRLRSMLA